MDRNSVTAEVAKTEIQSIMVEADYHKREVRRHRRELRDCLRRAEEVRRRNAKEIGIEVVVVPQAHSQEAQSNGNHPRT